MKRFFCTRCQKVRRVRKWPMEVAALSNLHGFYVGEHPVAERVGECSWHNTPSHGAAIRPTPSKSPSTRMVSAPSPAKGKGKGKGKGKARGDS